MKFSELVIAAYNKNQALGADDTRTLHRTLLQRQLWSRLQKSYQDGSTQAVNDTKVL
eukprot:m.351598 g.351598  ORF g.351598 m.351598 type:complete len:57 (+) comp16289_c0_seq1:907-1077(+)